MKKDPPSVQRIAEQQQMLIDLSKIGRAYNLATLEDRKMIRSIALRTA